MTTCVRIFQCIATNFKTKEMTSKEIKEKDLPLLTKCQVQLVFECQRTKLQRKEIVDCIIVGKRLQYDTKRNEEIIFFEVDIVELKNWGYESYSRSKFITVPYYEIIKD